MMKADALRLWSIPPIPQKTWNGWGTVHGDVRGASAVVHPLSFIPLLQFGLWLPTLVS